MADNPVHDAEKYPGSIQECSTEVGRPKETDLDVQIRATSDTGSAKLAKDGVTILLPQPSDDPEDPLNWSWSKKHTVLAVTVLSSLLTDFGMTYGSVLFAAQASDLGVSVTKASTTASGGMFLQGPAGILAVPLVQRYGRLPVLFWSQFCSAFMVLGAALSPNYACFTALRALQGWFNTAPQIVGLTIVHDLFFYHERTRKVNIWVFCLLGGPAIGPFLAAWFVQAVSWRADFGILAAFHGFTTLLVVLFGEETLYVRDGEPAFQKGKGIVSRVKLLTGIIGLRMKNRPSVWSTLKKVFIIQLKPQILFVTVIYIMFLIAWIIGINLTMPQFIAEPPFSFGAVAQACAWIAPIIGVFLGELWGHWFNDFIQKKYIETHNGQFRPEARLWGTYPATLVGFIGLVVIGQVLEKGLHWIGLMFGWGMIGFAMVAASTAVSAYALDCFPEHSSLVASIINMWRTTGGFCVVYFQFKWIATSGYAVTFGCQAMTLGVAFIAGVVTTQIWGRRWRAHHPAPKDEE